MHLQAGNTSGSLLSASGAQKQGMQRKGGLLRFTRSWSTKSMPTVCCSGRSESPPLIGWGSFNSSSETSVKPNQVRLPISYTPSTLQRHWRKYHFSAQSPQSAFVGRAINLSRALVRIKGGVSCIQIQVTCLSLQPCQDPCVQAQAMSRLSSDPK